MVRQVKDGFETRLRFGKGQRGRFVIKVADEALAERRATKLQELASMLTASGRTTEAPIILRKGAEVSSEKDFADVVKFAEGLCSETGKRKAAKALTTFGQLADRWTTGALHREYPDHVGEKKTKALDKTRLEAIKAIPVDSGAKFGDLPLPSVSLDHCTLIMANLPASAKRPATRRQYAQLLHRVLELAVFPCRLIGASPLPRGFMPKVGSPPGFSYLYPDEEAALMAALESAVPLARRLLWGFLCREGCRTGEATDLRIGVDVDLDKGVIRLDENKTDDPRAWALNPAVVRALAAWAKFREAKPGDFLFVDEAGLPFDNQKLAGQLRVDLKAAGVTRTELFENGKNTRKLRAHDLRGTFVTLSLAEGKSETWVMDRTGHTTSAMLQRYRRAARSASELALGPLHPLTFAIPEIRALLRGGGPEDGPNNQESTSKTDGNPVEEQEKPKWRNRQTRRIQKPKVAA
ncbi:MAG TPA: tyrosine-type recombinase/integrase [Polyangiaceae bacterium]|nr:tyrosine-type recombinase/integrase [Polyangiaceae bacterium]